MDMFLTGQSGPFVAGDDLNKCHRTYCASLLVPIPSILSTLVNNMPVTTVPLPDKIDYTTQSVPVPGTKRPGQTGALPSFGFSQTLSLNLPYSALSEWWLLLPRYDILTV